MLNLYRYNPRTTADLLAIFERLGDRLVLPYQATREFYRNRLKAIGNPEQTTSKQGGALEKNRAGTVRARDTWSKQLAIDDRELQQLHDVAFQLLQEAIGQR